MQTTDDEAACPEMTMLDADDDDHPVDDDQSCDQHESDDDNSRFFLVYKASNCSFQFHEYHPFDHDLFSAMTMTRLDDDDDVQIHHPQTTDDWRAVSWLVLACSNQ